MIAVSTQPTISAIFSVRHPQIRDLAGVSRVRGGRLAAPAATFLVAVASFVAPAGLGTRDAALAAVLAGAVPVAAAVTAAAGFRLLQTAVELAWVAVQIRPRHGQRRPSALA